MRAPQASSQGRVLLDGLATAATDAAKVGSEAYAAAGGTVPAQQQQQQGPQSAEAAQQETREAWAGLARGAQ